MDLAASSSKLASQEQWTDWLSSVRALAKDLQVWEIINPNEEDTKAEELILSAPKLPRRPSEPFSKATKDEYQAWGHEVDIYKLELHAFEVQLKGLTEVNKWIATNVAKSYQFLLKDRDRPRDRMKALQQQFGLA